MSLRRGKQIKTKALPGKDGHHTEMYKNEDTDLIQISVLQYFKSS